MAIAKVALNFVIEDRIVELLFRCKHWGTRLALSEHCVTSLYTDEVEQQLASAMD